MKDRKFLNKRDLLLVLLVLGIAAGIWAALVFSSPSEEEEGYVPHAEIYFGGTLVELMPLDEDQVFSIRQRPNVVFEIRDGAIAFIESDCQDQVCVHAGFISTSWHFAACLPNFLILTIQMEEDPLDDDLDSVVG